MEQGSLVREHTQTFEHEFALSAQLVTKWRRFWSWMRHLLRLTPKNDELVVNNNRYWRGGICSYNDYLSSMLQAYLSLWLMIFICVAVRYLNEDDGLSYSTNLVENIFTPMVVLYWGIMVFIGLEKRLRASAFNNVVFRLMAFISILMAISGIVIGMVMTDEEISNTRYWYEVASKRGYNQDVNLNDYLSIVMPDNYEVWIVFGQILLCFGLVLLIMLPCYRNDNNLPTHLKEQLSVVKGPSTPVLLLCHFIVQVPIVVMLIRLNWI